MSKYLVLVIGVLTVYAALVTNDLNKKTEYISLLESNINFISDQLKQVQKAAEERELEYQRIDEEMAKKDRELEELLRESGEKSDEAKNWLLQTIPASVDNTIPY